MNRKRRDMYARFLGHLETDKFFLGQVLAAYRLHSDLDDVRLAEFLKCASGGLERLKACAAPDPCQRTFRKNVERIASYAECDPNQLVIVIRQVQVLTALRNSPGTTGTAALAARDRHLKQAVKKHGAGNDAS